jgi:ribonuclease Z
MKIIFLGTGNALSITRQMTAILFVFGRKAVLVDCGDGMGTVRNILKAGITLSQIDDIFLTHAHGDHISGIANVLFSKLVRGRKEKVRVFGNKDTIKIAKEIVFGTHDFLNREKSRIAFVPMTTRKQVTLPYGATVRAALVPGQKESVVPCFAYRFESGGKKVAFTADMISNPAFDRLAKGIDVLIHECAGLNQNRDEIHAVGHSTAKEAGEAAARAGSRELILTHLGDISVSEKEALKKEAGKYFRGKITIAEDLLNFTF